MCVYIYIYIYELIIILLINYIFLNLRYTNLTIMINSIGLISKIIRPYMVKLTIPKYI